MTDTLNAYCAESPVIVLLLMFIFGVCVGSFLNVLALRSLKEQSILWPESYCFSCNHKLSPLDNIPILSYMFLQGKCRYCKAGISWQYPFVEFCTGVVYASLAYVFLIHKIPLVNFDAMPAMANAIPTGLTHDLFYAIQQGRLQPNSPMSLHSEDLGFYKYGLFLNCLFFASTLITVTITDFREKLIPHEITYPSMIIGIVFGAMVRGDLLGTMAGIGASYIMFDFIAFYGGKFYMMTRRDDDDEEEGDEDEPRGLFRWLPWFRKKTPGTESEFVTRDSVKEPEPGSEPGASTENSQPALHNADAVTELSPAAANSASESVVAESGSAQSNPDSAQKDESAAANTSAEKAPSDSKKDSEEEEEIEVMGGGDAVLSAVMSAYLGWKGLVLALIIGFLAGTVMGLVLLFVEMKKAGLLRECGKNALKWSLICGLGMACVPLIFQVAMSGMTEGMETVLSSLNLTLNTAFFGAIGGALIGMVFVGTKVSKPFPFGPALALGGFIAMFLIPYWLPFY